MLESSGDLRLFLSVRQPTPLPSSSAALREGVPAAQVGQRVSNPGLRQANSRVSQLWGLIEFKWEVLNKGKGEELYGGLGCVVHKGSTQICFSTYPHPIHRLCRGDSARPWGPAQCEVSF